jgi:hypothetical protein
MNLDTAAGIVAIALLIALQSVSEGVQQTAQQTSLGRDWRTWYQAYTDGVQAVQRGQLASGNR